jgi:hypothetical protein
MFRAQHNAFDDAVGKFASVLYLGTARTSVGTVEACWDMRSQTLLGDDRLLTHGFSNSQGNRREPDI